MSKAAKKKKGRKGKKGKKKEDDLELTLEERFKRTTQEVDCIKEQLADRQDYARKSRASEQLMKEHARMAQETVADERQSKKELTFDLTRQYKTLQLQAEMRIQALEAQIKRQKEELDETKQTLEAVTTERDKLKEEKAQEVAALNSKLQFAQKSYEAIIEEALDSMAARMEDNRSQWEVESKTVDDKTQDMLKHFGTPSLHRPK